MANKTLSDFPVLTNLDAASVTHVQKELVDYQVPLDTLTQYVTENADLDALDEKTDPVDADMVGLMDSAAAGNALKKFSWANFKAKLKTYFDALYPSANGWITLGLTITYASADSPTFTATVPGDVTGVLSAGMKLKLTQTTVKYFIITAAPSYASGTGLTTLTLYGGTDYTLDDAAISNVYYSAMRVPHGFPMNPDKWTVEVSDTASRTKNSPENGTWYHHSLGSINIHVPIGAWELSYSVWAYFVKADGAFFGYTALSTSTNSASGIVLMCGFAINGYGGNTSGRTKRVVVTSKTPYYLIAMVSTAGITSIQFRNDRHAAIIRAVCAYL